MMEKKVAWDLKHGSEKCNKNDNWLDEIREMRGRILYDNGNRPSFKLTNGKYYDNDGLDEYCYHLTARVNNQLTGCIRILPLQYSSRSVTENAVGKQKFNYIFKNTSLNITNCAEISRWIVDNNFQVYKLGIKLAAGIWALMMKLQFNFIAIAGGYAGYLLKRVGATYITGFEQPVFSHEYNDYINIVQFNIKNPPVNLFQAIDEMSNNLQSYLDSFDFSSNFTGYSNAA